MPKRANTLTDKRVRQALEACSGHRDRAMFLLSVKAGLRAKEIAGLTWPHIDFQDGVLRLRTTKGDKPRTVPMAKELASELRMLRADSRHYHVFTNTHANKGAPLTPDAAARFFHRLYKHKLGWDGYSSHSGRRTFCTNVGRKIAAAGGSMRDVMAMMGHENLQTTQGYLEQSQDAQKKVVDML